MIDTHNEACKPTKLLRAEAIASRCLVVLLNNGILNRKTLGDMEITDNNASLHSIVSILRNERFIPIKSNRISENTCDYYMEHEEISRYKNPELRKQQYEEMEMSVEKKRGEKIIKGFMRFIYRLVESPNPWRHQEILPQKLTEIEKEINALLINKKGVS